MGLWEWGVLLAGIGFLLACLVACVIMLNLTQSLRRLEQILALTLEEARLALPELRHSLQQLDDMVTGVNDKFSAADRAVDATTAAISGIRERVRERFDGLFRRTKSSQEERSA